MSIDYTKLDVLENIGEAHDCTSACQKTKDCPEMEYAHCTKCGDRVAGLYDGICENCV